MGDDLIEWMGEKLNAAENRRDESFAIAPNSYGAGYDQGYYDGLREALAKVTEPRAVAE